MEKKEIYDKLVQIVEHADKMKAQRDSWNDRLWSDKEIAFKMRIEIANLAEEIKDDTQGMN